MGTAPDQSEDGRMRVAKAHAPVLQRCGSGSCRTGRCVTDDARRGDVRQICTTWTIELPTTCTSRCFSSRGRRWLVSSMRSGMVRRRQTTRPLIVLRPSVR